MTSIKQTRESISGVKLIWTTLYKYALWEARSVLSKDVASGTSVVAVDEERGDVVGMMLGRPVSRYEEQTNYRVGRQLFQRLYEIFSERYRGH